MNWLIMLLQLLFAWWLIGMALLVPLMHGTHFEEIKQDFIERKPAFKQRPLWFTIIIWSVAFIGIGFVAIPVAFAAYFSDCENEE